MTFTPAGPYSIGSDTWNGLSKMMEESGEVQDVLSALLLSKHLGRVQQIGGKIIGAGGAQIHFDGSDLRARMIEELGDLAAAVTFFILKNDLNPHAIEARADMKLTLFAQWNADNRAPTP